MTELKNKIEAVLFSVGRRISVEELRKLTHSYTDKVVEALQELAKEYEAKQTSLMIVNDGDYWKLTTRDQFHPVISKIVTETDLSKTLMETLAVIAFKYPILQSDLIKIRTNKAYEHLKELEAIGYITRKKHGRTNLIKLTDKFFKYFDLTEDKLKDQFKDFESIASAIESKERTIEELKAEQKKRAEEAGQHKEEKIGDLVVIDEPPLAENKEEAKAELIVEKDNLDGLEIVDEAPEEEKEEKAEEARTESQEKAGDSEEVPQEKEEAPEDKEVDKRVAEILGENEEKTAEDEDVEEEAKEEVEEEKEEKAEEEKERESVAAEEESFSETEEKEAEEDKKEEAGDENEETAESEEESSDEENEDDTSEKETEEEKTGDNAQEDEKGEEKDSDEEDAEKEDEESDDDPKEKKRSD